MTDDDSLFHMVEFRGMNRGVQLVRGRRKTEDELQAEDDALNDICTSGQLQVRVMENCNTVGGKALLLCDHEGNRLPGQVRASLEQTADGAEFTVTFAIDGEEMIFA